MGANDNMREAIDRSRNESRLTAEEQMFRDAILDVVDGDEWKLYELTDGDEVHPHVIWTESQADAQRLDFADAVIARSRVLKTEDD